MKTITPSELSSLSPNCLLIDVRTPAEFQEKHIPSSINIPLHTLQPEKIRSLIRQDSPCVLICGSGNRARQAAEKLQSAGISQTIILEGGIKACEAISLPLNRGKKTLSIERQVRIAAGTLVLLGAILSLTVHPAFAYLAAFVGAGLIFAGVTDWCGMALLLARMPWNQASPSCGCASEKKPLSA